MFGCPNTASVRYCSKNNTASRRAMQLCVIHCSVATYFRATSRSRHTISLASRHFTKCCLRSNVASHRSIELRNLFSGAVIIPLTSRHVAKHFPRNALQCCVISCGDVRILHSQCSSFGGRNSFRFGNVPGSMKLRAVHCSFATQFGRHDALFTVISHRTQR